MDIITRNFFRLLRAGVFSEEVQIEPMSAWKWRQLYHYTLMHGLTALAYDGIQRSRSQFFMQLPDDLLKNWQLCTHQIENKWTNEYQGFCELYDVLSKERVRPILTNGLRLAVLYDRPNHRVVQQTTLFFPFQTQGQKADQWAQEHGQQVNDAQKYQITYQWQNANIKHLHRLLLLTNKFLNRSLQNIIEKELREGGAHLMDIRGKQVETTSNTLEMLCIFVTIAQELLNNGIPLRLLVDLGIMLRKIGDKIDFVQLQNWIDKLRLKRISHLSGMLLITLFNFSADELPFVVSKKQANLKPLIDELFLIPKNDQNVWFFQQGNDIFVHARNSSAMMWHVQHSVHYLKYYPAESITNFFSTFVHSLSHIEE